MECIIPGNNVKILGKALQALVKIGDELYIEAKKDTLSFVALNASKTVCGRFNFSESFFSCYNINQNDSESANDENITCKIHTKVFLPLFKGNLEKKLDYFKLEYTANSDLMVCKMKYKCDDILMVHRLRLMDNEALSIGVLADSGSNNIGNTSSFYNQLLSMFNTSDDEITFEITTNKVVVRNYCEGTPCRPKMMRSQINLNSTEFLVYNINKETTINFSLKPFRTVIHFGEAFNLNIDLIFEIGGKPLTMVMRSTTFDINFLVATLDPCCQTNSSTATHNSLVTKVQTKGKEVADDDLLAMESENWEKNNTPSKESTFSELMKQARNNKENIDVIPRSPESPRTKKAKTVFGRCYDPTFHETILGEVLAADSDSE